VYISELFVTVKMMIAIVVDELAAHDTPLCHLTARPALVLDFLPTGGWCKEYLRDRLSETILHL
jgi:hypothetical protein